MPDTKTKTKKQHSGQWTITSRHRRQNSTGGNIRLPQWRFSFGKNVLCI
ncbi:MAG: hypothetical protein HY841_12970 [Bacteroidetes bacterium]|nr:hypothetical protein [Bacteroidota bacterium]